MSNTIESLVLEINSNSMNAVQGIDALTQSLMKLKQATKGSLGLSKVSKETEKLKNTTEKSTKANIKAATSFTDLYYKMRMGIQVIKAVGSAIYSAIEKSSDYVENLNLFTVSMGEFAEEAKLYGEEVGDILGIDPSEWMRNQGVFMTLATGFGVASDRAAIMSKNLTQLGYDLSSFFNISYEDAMQKLQSGLSGELEPLRRIGYDLSQAKLEATALELGIKKSVSSMTQAEKAQLRYYAIMTQVTTAQGDMARTLDAPANQLKIFKAQLSIAGREIGNMFVPALNSILPYAIAVTKVIGNLASILASLFGYEIPDMSESTAAVVENTDALTENLEESQEEAKKLKSYMLGLDELNVINPKDSESEDISSGFDFPLPEYDVLAGLVESRLSTIVEDMKKWLGLTGEIDSWADLFNTRLGGILISTGLVAGSLLTWAVTESLTNTIKMLSNLSKVGSFTLGLSLVVIGITIGALAIESALTEGLNSTNAGALLAASASIVAGGALIGKTFGNTLIGAAVSAIVAGVVGLGVGLYDAIKNELNVANGLTIAFSTVLIGLGVAALIPAVATGMGAIMGAIVGAAIVGTIWLIQNTETVVEKIGAILSGALLALGAIFAFCGINIPLGIGLMVAGAVSMGASIAMNTDALSDEVKGVIAVITSVVSVALLAVGAALAFTGANIPLGIGLMAAGALTMGAAIIPNWNELSDSIQNIISIILAAVGGALLVVGAVLAFSGAGLPLGIGLMLAGAASLGTAIALNWDNMGSILKTVLGSILAILSGAILVLGVFLLLSGAGIGLGLALIFASLAGSYAAWKLDDNPITNFVKKMANGILNIINAIIDGINWIGNIRFPGLTIGEVEIIPAFNTKLWNIPKIPLMAEGGFPDEGQMFIAREAGPEMVGNIGRRTAVVNNEQIVASISGGVAEANEEQNALLREQNSLLRALLDKESGVYLDGKNLTNSVEKYQRERGRVLITGGVI